MLFEAMRRIPKWGEFKTPKSSSPSTPLESLLKDLRALSSGDWKQDFDSLFEFFESEAASAFNSYVVGIYRHVSDIDHQTEDIIAHSPGLSWESTYLWSNDPKETCRSMVKAIEQDSALIRGIR